jgi:hypothetical protein
VRDDVNLGDEGVGPTPGVEGRGPVRGFSLGGGSLVVDGREEVGSVMVCERKGSGRKCQTNFEIFRRCRSESSVLFGKKITTIQFA